jgi:crotonobetainyl-CoA hydratase
MESGVKLDQRGAVLVITLDRPKANAINADTSRALYDAFSQLMDRTDLRVGVLTGAGDRFFSAGWDLKAAVEGEGHNADHGPGGFAGLTELFDLRKPVVAAVNGSAYGGGVELMLACHLVVAADHAVFAFPEAKLGILPDAGGLSRLPSLLPRPLALEILLTGREFSAREAHAWGLVNRVVPPDQVIAAALELSRSLCDAAPLAVSAVLQAVWETQGLSEREAFAALHRMPTVSRISETDDAREGVRAFAEKRTPVWTGR